MGNILLSQRISNGGRLMFCRFGQVHIRKACLSRCFLFIYLSISYHSTVKEQKKAAPNCFETVGIPMAYTPSIQMVAIQSKCCVT